MFGTFIIGPCRGCCREAGYSLLVDAHCHLHEFGDGEIEFLMRIFNGVLVAVSDDYESSLRSLELAKRYPGRVIPCVGLHPWEVRGEESVREAEEIARLARRVEVPCIGEVGLDSKFCPQTLDVQRRVFSVLLNAAAELDALVNIHSPGTWGEVLSLLEEMGIKRANFHWYTGPLDLLEKITSMGYTISINPAIAVQLKHQRVAEEASLGAMLTESDAPYKYRGLRLSPLMIPDTISRISALKRLDERAVEEAIEANLRRVLPHPL